MWHPCFAREIEPANHLKARSLLKGARGKPSAAVARLKIALPGPGVAAHGVKIACRAPAHHLGGAPGWITPRAGTGRPPEFV